MAITKILNILETKGRNPATHLKVAVDYIQNADKTNEQVLVGSINCMPETAFEQMLETKELFEKTGKRQGYHIIISFSPEEVVTKEQAMYVMEHFAKDVLEDQYEAVYSVHVDKDHMHGHLIWNSVSLVTGQKYVSPKGNWKRKLQPITNKYCKELGLDIIPAEYSKNPKNMTRDQWELEQSLKDYILKDAIFCIEAAGSIEHFKFLMKRLGYEFKDNAYLEVRIPGRKNYHKLNKLDNAFGKNELDYRFNPSDSYTSRYASAKQPYYHTNNMWKYSKGKFYTFQRGYYSKIYRLRMVEQKRFKLGSAYYAAELKKMHILQERYLFIVDNRIERTEDLVKLQNNLKNEYENISNKQKEIYRNISRNKRYVKNQVDLIFYQQWHVMKQEELDPLKSQKKECKNKLKIIDAIWEDSKAPDFGKMLLCEAINEYEMIEMPEYIEAVKDEVNRVVDEVDIVEGVEYDNRDILSNVVETLGNAMVEEVQMIPRHIYQAYTELEKAKVIGIGADMNIEEVFDKVNTFYSANDYSERFSEIYDESKGLFEAVKKDSVDRKVNMISLAIAEKGGYRNLTYSEKTVIFQLDMLDNRGNLGLFSKVMKKIGETMDMDELYEEYQKVYDGGMDKGFEGREGKENRVR